jgi:glucose-6-phosphate isomerase, archaeal
MNGITELLSTFDPLTGTIDGAPLTRRSLADLHGCFSDTQAYERALAAGNPVLYTVAGVEPGTGEGDLHYGVGMIMPGRIGDEYYMTKGHLHTWRDAAEVYIGIAGTGAMLLEHESDGESRMVPLGPQGVVYVPGHTAHRTMNTGSVPLIYVGVYPARAGHDYTSIAKNNFRCMIVDRGGEPVMVERKVNR